MLERLRGLRFEPWQAVAVWMVVAVVLWGFLLGISYPLVAFYRPALTDSSLLYFYSSAAQSVAALGALVFVASFTVLQANPSRAAGVLLMHDSRFQIAVGIVCTSVLLPLYLLVTVPPQPGPANAAHASAMLALALCAIVMMVQYSLAVAEYLRKDDLRPRLMELHQKAVLAQRPGKAHELHALSLTVACDDALAALSPAHRQTLTTALRDLRDLSSRALATGDVRLARDVVDAWTALGVGSIRLEGARTDSHLSSSGMVLRSLWKLTQDRCPDQADARCLFHVITRCTLERRAAGDAKWADRFWDSYNSWIGQLELAHGTHPESLRHTMTGTLPDLFLEAFALLIEEASGVGVSPMLRIAKVWGPESCAVKALDNLENRAQTEMEMNAMRGDRLRALAHPVAAALVMGGLVVRGKSDRVETAVRQAQRLPGIAELLDDSEALCEPLESYTVRADIGTLPEDYSEVTPPPVAFMVGEEFADFALYVKCAIESSRPQGEWFSGLRPSELVSKWFPRLHQGEIVRLARTPPPASASTSTPPKSPSPTTRSTSAVQPIRW